MNCDASTTPLLLQQTATYDMTSCQYHTARDGQPSTTEGDIDIETNDAISMSSYSKTTFRKEDA